MEPYLTLKENPYYCRYRVFIEALHLIPYVQAHWVHGSVDRLAVYISSDAND